MQLLQTHTAKHTEEISKQNHSTDGGIYSTQMQPLMLDHNAPPVVGGVFPLEGWEGSFPNCTAQTAGKHVARPPLIIICKVSIIHYHRHDSNSPQMIKIINNYNITYAMMEKSYIGYITLPRVVYNPLMFNIFPVSG